MEANAATIILDENLLMVWSFGFYGGDWLAALMKDADVPNRYYFNYRFKYFAPGTRPFDPNDRRSDSNFRVDTVKTMDEVVEDLKGVAETMYLMSILPHKGPLSVFDCRGKTSDEVMGMLGKVLVSEQQTRH